MSKTQSAVLARIEVEERRELPLPPPEQTPAVARRKEPRTAERIRDALLQWLEEEA